MSAQCCNTESGDAYVPMEHAAFLLYFVFFFLLALVSGSRFVYRGLRIIRHSYLGDASRHAIATMVIGAGDSANFLIKIWRIVR